MLSDSKISTLESGFKNFRICLRIRRMRVDAGAVSGKKSCGFKNFRIRMDGALGFGRTYTMASDLSAVSKFSKAGTR